MVLLNVQDVIDIIAKAGFQLKEQWMEDKEDEAKYEKIRLMIEKARTELALAKLDEEQPRKKVKLQDVAPTK